jgi:hypothetical protein
MGHEYPAVWKYRFNFADCVFWYAGTLLTAAFQSQGHEQRYRDESAVQVAVFGTARSPHFSQAIISVTVQLWI